jgi:putative IMPACT (imprinted ancient) family translation regulator
VAVLERVVLQLQVPFALLDTVYRFIAGFEKLEKLGETYDSGGLILELELIAADAPAFSAALADLGSGQVIVKQLSGD